MDFNSLLPLLKILTSPVGQKIFFFLVVGLTVVVTAIRITLRKDLENLISQVKKLISEGDVTLKHPIIQEAEKRIDTYENRADKFNASVIIDQIYSRNKLAIASRDSWDFICRSFPNVLISLGLLGTFVGITSNLSSIQGILNDSTITNEEIKARFQEPLNAMATAFGSSLIALVCGIALTFVNLIFNTTVAKYRFLSLLEDYLNSKAPSTPTGAFLTEIQGSLRSFRQEMVSIFKNEIAQAIGNSFTSQIAQITEENRRLTANLNSLVSGFRDSATRISNSSEAFKYAAEYLSSSNLPNSINNFSGTIERVTSILEETSNSIAGSSNQFQEAAQKLDAYAEKSTALYDKLNEVMLITQSNQEKLLDTMPIIEQERAALSSTVELIGEIQSNITHSANAFATESNEITLVKNELIKLTKNVKSLAAQVTDKLYQTLDFNTLHEDNQKVINLLEDLISNANLITDSTLNTREISPSEQSLQLIEKINQLVIITNVVNDNIQSIQSVILESRNCESPYDFNDSLDVMNSGQINQIVEEITAVKRGILVLQRLINNINEQITLISDTNQKMSETALFPTVKKIFSKRVMGN
jgi:hypothetical protein